MATTATTTVPVTASAPATTTPSFHFEFCYILMLPYDSSVDDGQIITAPVPKDAPYFYELDIQYRKLPAVEKTIDAVRVKVQPQVLNHEVWVAECFYSVSDPLDDSAILRKQTINAGLRALFIKENNYDGPLIEEYTVLLISGLTDTPDDFVQANRTFFAQLLRRLDRVPDDGQIRQILQSQTRYAGDDVTIVDWEGALVISPGADFHTEIDLFKIGNYHLLKYRLVDEQIDEQLLQLRGLIGRKFSWFSNKRETLQKVVENRIGLMLDFENTDQSILLIGDWYPAQLYRIIFDEFYIEEWKAIVSNKLENLSSIAEVSQQNLTLSWERLLDFIQLIGWLVVLIGYIFLFLHDAKIVQ
jgi:hypothetical protein